MDGFKRPNRPQAQTPQPATAQLQRDTNIPEAASNQSDSTSIVSSGDPVVTTIDTPTSRKTTERRKKLAWLLPIILLVIGIGVALIGWWWYAEQLAPVDPDDASDQKVVIERGDSVSSLASELKERNIIRNSQAFEIHAKLFGKSGIKEGTCIVAKSQTVDQILDKFVAGCHDFKAITFFPGATIEKPLYKPDHAQLDQTMYIKYRLTNAGYSEEEITSALNRQYSGPLFAGKPAGASLEGYIYGETYYVDTNASVEKVLQTTFDQMYKDITKDGLDTAYAQKDLSLYEAITLASIVQRELNCEGKPTPERKERCYQYQRTIAQIFLKRLNEGMSLGSDVTFIYAADMRGVPPTVDIDSPYNTRIHTGLPPGPIASPGLLALKAVADPSDTDYVFFIAGDDGLIYFAKDQAGHERNIRDHCQQLCNEL